MSLLDLVFSGLAVAAAAAVAVFIIRERRENRKPGCHCWACRRMDKAPRDPQLTAELGFHFYRWEHDPTVTPDRERS
jgi:hypothetical protein